MDEYLQSVSNPAVYAAGDAVASGGPSLTPVAGYEGLIAAANLLAGNHRKASYLGVHTVAFTIPPLASVGLSEHSAREQGLKFRTHREITSSWYSSRRVGEDCSARKDFRLPHGRIRHSLYALRSELHVRRMIAGTGAA